MKEQGGCPKYFIGEGRHLRILVANSDYEKSPHSSIECGDYCYNRILILGEISER